MKKTLASILRWFGVLRYEFLVARQDTYPEQSENDAESLILVESGEIKKWACLACPGGCGERISLSLNPDRRPRWRVVTDFWQRPSLHPSVHQKNECGCHFWIKKGQVHWCKGGRPKILHTGLPLKKTRS